MRELFLVRTDQGYYVNTERAIARFGPKDAAKRLDVSEARRVATRLQRRGMPEAIAVPLNEAVPSVAADYADGE